MIPNKKKLFAQWKEVNDELRQHEWKITKLVLYHDTKHANSIATCHSSSLFFFFFFTALLAFVSRGCCWYFYCCCFCVSLTLIHFATNSMFKVAKSANKMSPLMFFKSSSFTTCHLRSWHATFNPWLLKIFQLNCICLKCFVNNK